MLSKIRDVDGKLRVLKELKGVGRALYYGTVQNCPGDDEEKAFSHVGPLSDRHGYWCSVTFESHRHDSLKFLALFGRVCHADDLCFFVLDLVTIRWSDSKKWGQIMETTSPSQSKAK